MAHGHLNLLDEHELCTDLKCPCGDLSMTQEEIDFLDNLIKACPVIVEFQRDGSSQPQNAADEVGDIVLIWEWDQLEVGWNDRRTAVKAANWYQRGPSRSPRIVEYAGPEMSKNRKE